VSSLANAVSLVHISFTDILSVAEMVRVRAALVVVLAPELIDILQVGAVSSCTIAVLLVMLVLFFSLRSIELLILLVRVISELQVFDASHVSVVTSVYAQLLREYSTSLFPLALLHVPVRVTDVEFVRLVGLVKVTYESENT
jgi:hypothetical protein